MAILGAAASEQPVAIDRLLGFARLALEANDLSRLALAVLEGGERFVSRRAVELARFVERHARLAAESEAGK